MTATDPLRTLFADHRAKQVPTPEPVDPSTQDLGQGPEAAPAPATPNEWLIASVRTRTRKSTFPAELAQIRANRR